MCNGTSACSNESVPSSHFSSLFLACQASVEAVKLVAPVGKWALSEGLKAATGLVKFAMVEGAKAEKDRADKEKAEKEKSKSKAAAKDKSGKGTRKF
jgi:hypothetical protein